MMVIWLVVWNMFYFPYMGKILPFDSYVSEGQVNHQLVMIFDDFPRVS